MQRKVTDEDRRLAIRGLQKRKDGIEPTRAESAAIRRIELDRIQNDQSLSKQSRYARRRQSEEAEIGDLPMVANPRRRALCGLDPGLFAFAYFPEGIGQGLLSADHFSVIDTMERCFTEGGLYAQAIFRGFIKTTAAECLALWAMLYGHRRFIAWVGADDKTAGESVDAITKNLEENERLAEDFPEVCFPLAALEHKHQRCDSQTYHGERTHSRLVTGQLVLPTLRLSAEEAARTGIPVDERGYTINSGSRLDSFGILSFKRGRKHNRADGRIQRIDAVVVDDFQTDLSAVSPADVNRRLSVIRKSILRSGSHREAISAVINGTVIAPGDGMAQLMDRKLFPKFRTRLVPMLKSMPDDEAMKIWQGEYVERLRAFDPMDDGSQKMAREAATAIYRSRRAEMDHGAIATWDRAFSEDECEISAIQHAMNIFLMEGPDVFDAECQQNPRRKEDSPDELTTSQVMAKASGLPRGLVPLWANTLTAFIDVQEKALYWLVAAWGEGFRGHVLDYGMFPEQSSGSLSLGECKWTLRHKFAGIGLEGSIRAGLDSLTSQLLSREFEREEDHIRLNIQRLAIDAADNSALIYEMIRESPRRGQILPSKGKYFGASTVPIEEYKKQSGEEISIPYRYIIRPTAGAGSLRLLRPDTNWWKSFAHKRLKTAKGDAACVTLFGHERDHVQFADHVLSEYRIQTQGRGRTVDEWKPRPGAKNNHLLDCFCGACVVASTLGVTLASVGNAPGKPKRVSFSQMQKARR